jgi:hypothetical protein
MRSRGPMHDSKLLRIYHHELRNYARYFKLQFVSNSTIGCRIDGRLSRKSCVVPWRSDVPWATALTVQLLRAPWHPIAVQPVRLAGGWWLVLMFWEKSTADWLLAAGLLWEKSTAGWWVISQANRLMRTQVVRPFLHQRRRLLFISRSRHGAPRARV